MVDTNRFLNMHHYNLVQLKKIHLGGMRLALPWCHALALSRGHASGFQRVLF